MEAPDKIYIQQDMINNLILEEREYADDVEYIHKEALLKWLESKVYEHNEDRFDDGFNAALGQVIDKLNEM